MIESPAPENPADPQIAAVEDPIPSISLEAKSRPPGWLADHRYAYPTVHELPRGCQDADCGSEW